MCSNLPENCDSASIIQDERTKVLQVLSRIQAEPQRCTANVYKPCCTKHNDVRQDVEKHIPTSPTLITQLSNDKKRRPQMLKERNEQKKRKAGIPGVNAGRQHLVMACHALS
jgi:hypothetical protein